ncbi:MAG: hypothetical protein NC037_02875 [Bacteroides sp.]|nr:hypothetical protein [Bacillota bacterium]MCM1393826.1 hypothetical protein [[Eubacterium] siraeum]MCM1455457.1 hypothetical protein [Bacteroides sp.]
MKNKRYFLAIIVCVLIAVASIGLVACGDKGNSGLKENQLTFAEGTTIEDIYAMFENGEINSLTVRMIMETDDMTQENEIKIDGNLSVERMYANGVELETYISYSVYEQDEHRVYTIVNPYASSMEKDYFWQITEEDFITETLEMVRGRIGDNEVTISATSVECRVNAGGDLPLKLILQDFNCTTESLPSEYSNYKELAQEKNW